MVLVAVLQESSGQSEASNAGVSQAEDAMRCSCSNRSIAGSQLRRIVASTPPLWEVDELFCIMSLKVASIANSLLELAVAHLTSIAIPVPTAEGRHMGIPVRI